MNAIIGAVPIGGAGRVLSCAMRLITGALSEI